MRAERTRGDTPRWYAYPASVFKQRGHGYPAFPSPADCSDAIRLGYNGGMNGREHDSGSGWTAAIMALGLLAVAAITMCGGGGLLIYLYGRQARMAEQARMEAIMAREMQMRAEMQARLAKQAAERETEALLELKKMRQQPDEDQPDEAPPAPTERP